MIISSPRRQRLVGGAAGTNFSGAIGITGPAGTGADGNGAFQSAGFNLVGRIAGLAGVVNQFNGDLSGTDRQPLNPQLASLQWNGGPTETLALLLGSPAINAGDDNLLGAPNNLSQDQCGNPRKSGQHVDIGAFEHNGLSNGRVLSPWLSAEGLTGDGFQFWFNGATGKSYSVWGSTDLLNWTQLGSAKEFSPGWFGYQDANAMNLRHQNYPIRYP